MQFNDQQLTAIQSDEKYLLVLAGAGTGKTRTIIGRAAHLLERGTPADRIAIVTFTRRAAAEIKHRLVATIGKRADPVTAGTFHHLCLRTMRARPKWFGYHDMTILDRDDQLQLLRLIRSGVVDKKSKLPQAAELLGILSFARNTNQGIRRYIEKYTEIPPEHVDAVLKIYQLYSQRKHERGYLDYDDILQRFAEVLQQEPQVREAICGQYDHLLVDEMQDTNPLQWSILESFSHHCHLFCVGDDAQSIYAFRGADFRNVHSFAKRLPGATTLPLTLNYRSTQPILDVANWLLVQSSLPYNKVLRADRGGGVKPILAEFASEYEEAEWVAEQIRCRHQAGAKWSDHMILSRTAYTARPMEAALIEAGIPYRFIGGMSLLQVAHVRDILAAIRTVVNYRDELAWMRYLMLFPGIGEVRAGRAVRDMLAAPDREAAWEVLCKNLSGYESLAQIPMAIAGQEAKPSAAIALAAEAMTPLLERTYDDWDRRQKDLSLLQRMAAKHSTLAEFLETYTLDPVSVSEVDNDAQEGVVTLITVHSAKGTEAPTCFVISAQAGSYPHSRSLGDPEAIEEERRVLYVALTRAQDELIITRNQAASYHRFSWQRLPMGSPDDFLEDLPRKLVEYHDVDLCSYDSTDSTGNR
ncbi:MAG: DNA helicase [Pirellulaceae bacterium]|nr:MAG: DNA helicase [Pirellulaceae bacterium]